MRRAIMLLLLLPSFVACGGGSDGDAREAERSSASESTSELGGSDDGLELTDDRTLSEDELADVLPSLQDMPAGFTKSADDDEDEDQGDFMCGTDLEGDPVADASVDYEKEEGLSAQVFSFGVGQYDSADDVAALMEDLKSAIDECPSFTDEGTDYKVDAMSVGQMGDEAVGFKIAGSSDGFDVTVDMIAVASGEGIVISMSAGAGLGGPDIQTLADLSEDVVERYATAAAD